MGWLDFSNPFDPVNPFDDIGHLFGLEDVPVVGDLFGGLGDPLGTFSGANAADKRQKQYQDEMGRQREQRKRKQYELINSMQAPQLTPQMETRLKALEDESRPGPLVEDPYFQGARANLVQGGQAALSSVQNQQRANDNSGGFRNQGSISDIYDRLGSQLAQLGQQSVNVKSQKADRAAQARQDFANAQMEYQNALTRAKMAVESEDANLMAQALNQAYAAKEKSEQARRQMVTGIFQAAGSVVGGMYGGPQGAAAGGQMGGALYPSQNMATPLDGGGQTMGGYGAMAASTPMAYGGYGGSMSQDPYSVQPQMTSMPWAFMRNSYGR